MSNSQQKDFRQIFKATSLFGGVQVFQIIITILRGKAVAFLLGPAGMGINGLLNSSIQFIQSLSSLGLPQSAIKDIAASSNDVGKQIKTYSVFRKLIIITAFLGFLIAFLGASWISQYTFDNQDYTWAYRFIAFTFLFSAITGGVYTALRGKRELKKLASANILGAVLGLILAVPMYYFYGIEGIVPALLLVAFGTFLIAMYYKHRYLNLEIIPISYRSALKEGLPMIKLGLSMSATTLLASGVAFLTLAFISNYGELNDVGLYSAAQTITASYVGMIFTAMSTDYFPRLSESFNKPGTEWHQVVNQQTKVVLLLLVPLAFLLISTAPYLIRLLLSPEFLDSTNYIAAALLGVLLKAPVWSMGYVIIASGKARLFLVLEVVAILMQLSLTLFGYYNYGLLGMGFGFSASYLISLVIQTSVLIWFFKFKFEKEILLNIMFSAILLSIGVYLFLFLEYRSALWYLIPVTLFLSSFSLWRMNQLIGLSQFISSFLKN